ncbi:MAG: hypothetical protein J6W81_10240, partial [Lentisphaeria bacterium]|nr:hypothetical protein [Lentisphaeria bacterium]
DWQSGLKKIEYSYDYKNWAVGSTLDMGYNGTVYFRATDMAGNVSTTSATVNKVDKSAPSLTVTKGYDGWTLGSVYFTAQASDWGSGVKNIEYSYDNKNWASGNSVKMGYNGTIYFRATDQAGNSVIKSATMDKVDQRAPELKVLGIPTTRLNGTATVSVQATDYGSGIKTVEYSYDNSKWYTGSCVNMNYNGTIYFRATDNVGLTATTSATVTKIASTSSNNDVDADLLAGWEKGTDSSDLSGFSEAVNGNLTDDLCAYNDTITLFGNAAQDSLTDNLAASLDADSVLAEDKNKGMIA